MPFLNGYGPDPAVVIQNLYSQDLPSEDAPMTTDDLVAFLRARLHEDEQIARAAGAGTWDTPSPVVEASPMYNESTHIARHDPARVLHEVEAKRRVVDELVAAREGSRRAWANYLAWTQNAREPFPDAGTSDPHDKVLSGLERAAILLAATWADHPDYRQDWRL